MRIAVTGGIGRIGNHLVRRLAATGSHEGIGLTRAVAPYDDVAALRAALSGVDTMVFVSSDGGAAKIIADCLAALALAGPNRPAPDIDSTTADVR